MEEKLLEIEDLEVIYKSGNAPVHAVNGVSLGHGQRSLSPSRKTQGN